MIFCPASCGALLLCPQKQCLSGKTDRLSERTNQRLPCVKGGSLPPDSTPKRCNILYLACKTCKKGQRISHSLSFSVGANCVRPRAFTERPYEDDFLSVGITCFMEGTACHPHFTVRFSLTARTCSQHPKPSLGSTCPKHPPASREAA